MPSLLETITLPREILDEMLAHARGDAPNECCGLLIGKRGAIEQSVRAGNLQASSNRYLIDPADHFAAVHAARKLGLAVIGAYHSHPAGDAVPSATDINEASGDADFVYVIVAVAEGADEAVRAYLFNRGTSRSIRLEIC